ncbi:unnamed protein product [Umbelopsis sp. WA50703]
MTTEEEQPINVEAFFTMSIAEVRETLKATRKNRLAQLPPAKLEEPSSITDSDFQGPESVIPIRIYTPEGSGPFPGIVFYHGGGWIMGDLETYDSVCRAMCVGTGAVLVSVDYRLAPEYKFPAATEDAYAGLIHVVANAKKYNIDPTRIAVAGDSAGGNISAAVTLMTRDLRLFGKTQAFLNTSSFRTAYHRKPEDAESIYASPLLADLTGLPAAYLLTCDDDPLRDEGLAYCNKLKASGVPCEYTNVIGQSHGFFDRNKYQVPEVAQYHDAIFAAIKKALA